MSEGYIKSDLAKELAIESYEKGTIDGLKSSIEAVNIFIAVQGCQ